MEPLPSSAWRSGSRPAQRTLVAVILGLATASVAYRLLVVGHLEQTSALFIGLPTLLALALTLTPPARRPLGIIMKGTTIGLLLSGVLLGEGFICILMAAPLFYLVGLVVGLILNRSEGPRKARLYVLLLFLPQSLEGTREHLAFPRQETVSVARTLAGTAIDVERALRQAPRFERPLPLYLRLGFPRPEGAQGSGLRAGDARIVQFGKGHSQDLVLVVGAREPGRVVFRKLADDSPIAHWLDWQEADVGWEETTAGRTRVTWTLRYTRRLDPAWYFGPWERYAVGLAAGYLTDTLIEQGVALATPSP